MLRLSSHIFRQSTSYTSCFSRAFYKSCVANMTMKAVVVHEYGDASKLSYEDVPKPEAGEGEVVVKNSFCGVNFIDIVARKGFMPHILKPNSTLGYEASGVVESVGPGVDGVNKGDNVAFIGVGTGGYAEFSKVPAWRAIKAPSNVSLEQAGSTLWQGLTAYCFSTYVFPVQSGHKVLIQGIAGGVGMLLCQMAKLKGAYVIGTCSTEAKAVKAKAMGADEVILYSQKDFVEEVNRITDGNGVNVIYDGVGKTTFLKGFSCLASRGTMVLYGNASGPVDPIDPAMLAGKSHSLTFASHFPYTSVPTDYRDMSTELFKWISEGKLNFGAIEKMPLSQVQQAHANMENRKTTGKLLLEP